MSEDGLNVELTLVVSHPSPVPYSITVNTIDGTAQGMLRRSKLYIKVIAKYIRMYVYSYCA